jgi:predicted nucleic acid-binding protein
MTRYLLDTNVLTELEDRRKPGFALVAARLASLKDTDEVLLSILSAYEYRHGISKAPEDLKESLLLAWKAFEERFPSIGLTNAGAVLYGELKSRYQEHTGASSKQMKASTVDFILASSALEHDAVLVSDDRIFRTIQKFQPALRVQNWLVGETSPSDHDE